MNPSFYLILASGLLLGSSSALAGADAPYLGVIETPYFEVHYATTLEEEPKLLKEKTVPEMTKFVQFWEKRGFRLPTYPLRVFVTPTGDVSAKVAFSAFGGEGFRRALTDLVSTVNALTDLPALEGAVREFVCRYPIPMDTHPEISSTLYRDFTRGRTLDEAKRMISQLPCEFGHYLDDENIGSFNFWKSFGDSVSVSRDLKCMVLKISRYGLGSARPFSSNDVIFHELSHALHIESWSRNPDFFSRVWSSATIETLADLFAHIYLKDPCHRPEVDPDTNQLKCNRRMDWHELPLADEVWGNGGRYGMGQSIKHFFWNLNQESGLEALADPLSKAVSTLPEQLPVADPDVLARLLWPNNKYYTVVDPFLSFHGQRRDTKDQLTWIAMQACGDPKLASSITCQDMPAYLGKKDDPDLEAVRTFSPSQIGKDGINIPIQEGSVRFSFPRVISGYRFEASLERDGAVTSFKAIPQSLKISSETIPRKVSVRLRSPDGDELIWTSQGELFVTPKPADGTP